MDCTKNEWAPPRYYNNILLVNQFLIFKNLLFIKTGYAIHQQVMPNQGHLKEGLNEEEVHRVALQFSVDRRVIKDLLVSVA